MGGSGCQKGAKKGANTVAKGGLGPPLGHPPGTYDRERSGEFTLGGSGCQKEAKKDAKTEPKLCKKLIKNIINLLPDFL